MLFHVVMLQDTVLHLCLEPELCCCLVTGPELGPGSPGPGGGPYFRCFL